MSAHSRPYGLALFPLCACNRDSFYRAMLCYGEWVVESYTIK